MIKSIRKAILYFLVVAASVFILAPAKYPDNSQFEQKIDSVQPGQVAIIFNSGGWGYTPVEKADDLTPIVKGLQGVLSSMGYVSVVVPYKRTDNSFLGKIESSRDFLTDFDVRAEDLANMLDNFSNNNPGTTIIIAGLSNGAAFSNAVAEKMSEDGNDKPLVVEVGLPFWEKPFNNGNILSLNNNGQDSFSNLDTTKFLGAIAKAPFKWLGARAVGNDLPFGAAIYIPGHQYSWDSVSLQNSVINFINERL